MKFSDFTFLSKEKRPPLFKLRTYCRSTVSENALMVSLRLRTRNEVQPVRKVNDEEFEMIRERLAKKLRFDFTETPNVSVNGGHGMKFPNVNSIQQKLCKRLNR
ncbi:hypothetical protein M758_9G068000 [Ceratodon purpureus]|nr:hypothetical protein M758_9G068000 [Ceratodon purpureus]